MPFGLVNAGATYQRMIDNRFKNMLGQNMKAYVDDMLVKLVKAICKQMAYMKPSNSCVPTIVKWKPKNYGYNHHFLCG